MWSLLVKRSHRRVAPSHSCSSEQCINGIGGRKGPTGTRIETNFSRWWRAGGCFLSFSTNPPSSSTVFSWQMTAVVLHDAQFGRAAERTDGQPCSHYNSTMHNKTEPSQTMAPETCSASTFGPEISVVDLTGAFHLETRSDQQGCFARSFPSTYCVSHDNSLPPEDRRPQQKTLVVWVVC